MTDGDGMEFQKAAEVLIAREPNYSPFNDDIYMLDLDRVRNLLAMAMRIAAEEAYDEFAPQTSAQLWPDNLEIVRKKVAARIESRIGEK